MTPPPIFSQSHGGGRLVVSIPHAGVFVPPDIAARLTDVGRDVVDTDWHVDRLYGFCAALDVTVIAATHSRTVVDLNRSPAGEKLYPGQVETSICPIESFAGAKLYAGAPPDDAEIGARVETYWRPYHAALAAALHRARETHGEARLLDAHSIPSRVPRLFDGTLPDLNIGTNTGAAAGPALVRDVAEACADRSFSMVVDGRFTGGYITRQYGDPASGLHAIQLEIGQDAYLDPAAPRTYDPARAAALVAVLRRVVNALA